MGGLHWLGRVVVLSAWMVSSVGLLAQFVGPGARKTAPERPAVEYLFPEQVQAVAGKPAAVALHFRVGEGLHVNSHRPGHPELIPTTLTIPAEPGVKLLEAVYPKGTEFSFALDPAYKLNVYTGEFVVRAQIVAEKGSHLVEAKLRYQACDNNACLPPRTITAAFEVVGK